MIADEMSSQDRIALLERRLSRATRALAEAETALENRMRDLASANSSLKQREEELVERLQIESSQLLSAQRVGGFATVIGFPGQPFQSSPELNRILGYPMNQKLDVEQLVSRIHRLDVARILEEARRFFTHLLPDQDHEFVHRIVHPLKGTRWLQWFIRRSSGNAGEPKGVLGSVRDITDIRNTERQVRALQLRAERRVRELDRLSRELQEERARAEAALDVRTRFLSTMAHQFRTPLATLGGLVDTFSSMELDENSREMLELAERSTERISALLDEALAEADGSSNTVSLFTAPISLSAFFKSSKDFWNTSLGDGRSDNFKLEVSPGLPDQVEGDALRLRELFDNLTGFGIETCGSIRLHAEWAGGLTLRMRPAGEFCPASARDLMESDPQMRRLMMLVEAMSGEVEFLADDAKLVVRLPLPILSETKNPDDQPLTTATGEQPQVLLAEDTASNRAIIVAMLEKLGCKVETAENGAEALAAATSRRFDAILMDVMMPVMDGEEAVRRIRASDDPYARTPVIGVTAHTLHEERERLLAAGMSACLSKPVKKMELRSSLRTALGAANMESGKVEHFDLEQFGAAFSAVPVHYRSRFLEAVETDLDGYGEKLVASLEAGDFDAADKHAHALKGVAGNIGAKQFLDQLAKLRSKMDAGEDISSKSVDLMIKACAEACRQLFNSRYSGD